MANVSFYRIAIFAVCEKSFLTGKALNAIWDKNKTEM